MTLIFVSTATQAACWFSISRQALRGASFTSPLQLRQAMTILSLPYNGPPHPWS
jgi:hypothetical protein